MAREPAKWHDDKTDNPPWTKALEVRRRRPLEGYCYHQVQAIIIAIDQYAEVALGNSEIFLEQTARHRLSYVR